MSSNAIAAFFIFIVALLILILAYFGIHSDDSKIEAGLQQCIITVPNNHPHVLWMKNCPNDNVLH